MNNREIIIQNNLHDLVVAIFHADSEQAERAAMDAYRAASDAHDAIYKSLFDDLQTGLIDWFYYCQGDLTVIFTRSIKEPGKIQRSTFWDRNGEMIALSDGQYTTAHDANKDQHTPDNVTICTGTNSTATAA